MASEVQILHNRRKYDGFTVEQKIDEALAMMGSIMDAFPEGPIKHREVHELWMETKKEEIRFWREMRLDIAKKGTWAMLVTILGLMVVALSLKMGVSIR